MNCPVGEWPRNGLRLQVMSSHPAYAGEQDADPRSTTDCATGSPATGQVRAAKFQAFSR